MFWADFSRSGMGIFLVPMTWNVHFEGGGNTPLQMYCKTLPLEMDIFDIVRDFYERTSMHFNFQSFTQVIFKKLSNDFVYDWNLKATVV